MAATWHFAAPQSTAYTTIYVVVQFYTWFNFYFPLFLTHYHTLPYIKTKENNIVPRIKLNHNIYTKEAKELSLSVGHISTRPRGLMISRKLVSFLSALTFTLQVLMLWVLSL